MRVSVGFAGLCEMEYTVHVTPYVLRQMTEISEYIRCTLQSPENAARWQDRMEQEFASLSFLPAQVPLTEEEPWHSRGIHKMTVGNYLVYFWIDDMRSKVWITAVVYGRRSQREQLEQMG